MRTEALGALRIERVVSKRVILEQYLNRTPFGAGTVGVEAASRRYFGKPSARSPSWSSPRASPSSPAAALPGITWLLDGEAVARAEWPYGATWKLARGHHRLELAGGGRRSDPVEFEVR